MDFKLTKDDDGIRKRAEHRQEKPTNDSRAENSQKNLASIRQKLGCDEHQVPIHKDQEDVSEHSGGARQESVCLVTAIRRRPNVLESQKCRFLSLPDSIRDQPIDRIISNPPTISTIDQNHEKEEGQKKEGMLLLFFHG